MGKLGKVVLASGCFDVLHLGHIRMLERAAEFGDTLFVAINSDRSVRKLKGPERPVIPEQQRRETLLALRCVDWVFIFDDPDPLRIYLEVHPDVIAKGSDWAIENIIGAKEVQSWGGQVAIIPLLPGYSTTAIVRRIRESHA